MGAAKDVVQQMKVFAANLWEVESEGVTFEDGTFKSLHGQKQQASFKELAEEVDKPIVGRGSVDPPAPGGAFATHIVDVEVDTDTGKVEILRYTAVQDVGKAIHPSYVEGQIQGGAVQGIGWALNEEYIYNDEGQMSNASFLRFRGARSRELVGLSTKSISTTTKDKCRMPVSSDSGGRGPGNWLGSQRRVYLQRRRTNVECQFPRLPDANYLRCPDDRNGDCRSAKSRPSLWGKGRRRSANCASTGCYC